MNRLRMIERIALVQMLLDELDGLVQDAEQMLDSQRLDLSRLDRRFRAINRLTTDADVGCLEIDGPYDEEPDAEPPQRNGQIAVRVDLDENSFGLNCLLPDASTRADFIPCLAVEVQEEFPGEAARSNRSSVQTVHEHIVDFVQSWKGHLKHVPVALTYCGGTELRLLSTAEVASTLGIDADEVTALEPVQLDDNDPLTSVSLCAVWRRQGEGNEEDFYDPISVAQFAALRLDLSRAAGG